MYVTLLPSPYYCIDHNTMGATADIGAQAPSRSAPGSHIMAGARAHISYLQYSRTHTFIHIPSPALYVVVCPPFMYLHLLPGAHYDEVLHTSALYSRFYLPIFIILLLYSHVCLI